LEVCVDKFLTSMTLARNEISTPQTMACQTWQEAMTAFNELGGDVVVKPLFGSEGRGIVRVTDTDLAWRTFRAIEQMGGIIYVQKFIQHPGWDVRVLFHRGEVLGAMKRHAGLDFRTNVALGGKAEAYQPSDSVLSLAYEAMEATGCVFAGVDLIENENGTWFVLEVNAVPGWKALSSVCNIDVASTILNSMKEAVG
jgi:RimK family alpha-L-glutamate ligase